MIQASAASSRFVPSITWMICACALSAVSSTWAVLPAITEKPLIEPARVPVPEKAKLSAVTGLSLSPVVEKKAGIEWVDHFRALESIDQAAIQEWMKSHHIQTRQYLAALLKEDTPRVKSSAVVKKEAPRLEATATQEESRSAQIQYVNKNVFYVSATEAEFSKIYVRETQVSPVKEHVLIDLSKWDVPAHTQIERFRVSPNGRWVAVLLKLPEKKSAIAKLLSSESSRAATDFSYRLFVTDAQTGKVVIRPIMDIEATSLLSWRPDSEAIFYSQRDESKRIQGVMRALSGTQAGKVFPVFGQGMGLEDAIRDDEQVGIITTPLSPYTLAVLRSPKGVRVFSTLVPQLSGQTATPIQTEQGAVQAPEMRIVWHPLIQLQDKVQAFDVRGDWFYAVTRRQQASGEVVRLRLSEPRWEEADLLIPADAKQPIQQLSAAQDALYVERRVGDMSHLIRLPYNARYQNTGELQTLSEPAAPVLPKTPVSTVPAASDAIAKMDVTAQLPTPSQLAAVKPTELTTAASSEAPTQATEVTADAAAPVVRKEKRYKHVKRRRIEYVRVKEVVALPVEKEGNADALPTDKASKKSGKKSKFAAKRTEKTSKYRSKVASQAHAKAKSRTKASKAEVAASDDAPVKASKGRRSHAKKGGHRTAVREYKKVVRHRLVRKVVEEEVPVEIKEAQEKRRARVRSRVVRLELSKNMPNNIRTIALPVEGGFQQLLTDPLVPGAIVQVNDWTNPMQMVQVEGQGEAKLLEGGVLERTQNVNKATAKAVPAAAEGVITSQTARLLVPADDSADAPMLPVTVISRTGVNPVNSGKPLLLVLERPQRDVHATTYRSDVRAWLNRGGVVALIDLFPQGIKDSEWLDAAHTMVESRYVSRLENVLDYLYGEKIAKTNAVVATAEGANASLLSMVMAKHPTRLAAVALQSGVYDGLRWKALDASQLANDAYIKRIGDVSSYYQLKDKVSYPAALVLGHADPAAVIQAAKLTARLQQVHPQNRAYFYSAAKPLSDETRLLFLWSQVPQD